MVGLTMEVTEVEVITAISAVSLLRLVPPLSRQSCRC